MKINKEQNRKFQNRKYKTLIKNGFKDMENIMKLKEIKNDISELNSVSKKLQKFIDKAARKGIIHRRNASRKVSRLFNIINLFNLNK